MYTVSWTCLHFVFIFNYVRKYYNKLCKTAHYKVSFLSYLCIVTIPQTIINCGVLGQIILHRILPQKDFPSSQECSQSISFFWKPCSFFPLTCWTHHSLQIHRLHWLPFFLFLKNYLIGQSYTNSSHYLRIFWKLIIST